MKLILVALIFCEWMNAQTAPDKYWIQFKDKNNSPFSLDNPSAFLSQKCIDRREKFNIGFDQRDIPINENYIEQILSAGDCSLHNKSKWFNAITINTADSALINSLLALNFVEQIRSVQMLHSESDQDYLKNEDELMQMRRTNKLNTSEWNVYGPSFRQIEMLNGHLLHQLGFRGEGMDIAVLDAGWIKTNELPAFEHLRNSGRIKMTRDFVSPLNSNIYNLSNHGTLVLSFMAGIIPDSLLGTAPDANYFLFRTEASATEFPVEEDNWVSAIELCDSLGIDVVNSSLGYTQFDDHSMDHTYNQLDGNTIRCSIAADIAASKGLLVVNSAGNSGDDPWHYIGAPSDGDSVLCIGAVDANRVHAPFSSYGPSADGDVKPNVVAMGRAAVFADLDSTISAGNGTSFSSPIIAGMAASLWQAFPGKSNMEIFHSIEQSAHLYQQPDSAFGYGIPDFWKAFTLLQKPGTSIGDLNAQVFPNPCSDYLNISFSGDDNSLVRYEIYDGIGKRIFAGESSMQTGGAGMIRMDRTIAGLSAGNYTIHLAHAGKHSVVHFEKIRP